MKKRREAFESHFPRKERLQVNRLRAKLEKNFRCLFLKMDRLTQLLCSLWIPMRRAYCALKEAPQIETFQFLLW